MVRGGHIDVTVLGALQVDAEGNLANWMIPGKMVKGMAARWIWSPARKRVIIAMEHTTKDGGHKIVRRCTLPFTGLKVVSLIVTEMAVIEVTLAGLVLKEIAADTTVEKVKKRYRRAADRRAGARNIQLDMAQHTDAVILSACRTPIGTFGGVFKELTAVDLGAIVIREAIARAGVKAAEVGDVIMGCVLQAGRRHERSRARRA